MRRSISLAACTLALAACGGGKDAPPANQAASTQFTYAAASPASTTQASALGTPVTDASAFAAAPSQDTALSVTDPSLITETLLGTTPYGIAAAAPGIRPLTQGMRPLSLGGTGAPGFSDPTCVKASATGITLTGCTMTVDSTSGDTTVHAVVTANGQVGYTASTGTIAWDVTIGESLTITGAQTASGSGSFHLSGSYVVTATTIVGHSASELAVSFSSGGQSMSVGVDESVDVNVTYAGTCATRVTGGTVEAKRIWTARPQGFTATQLPDRAAKVTWTGCGTADIQLGTH